MTNNVGMFMVPVFSKDEDAFNDVMLELQVAVHEVAGEHESVFVSPHQYTWSDEHINKEKEDGPEQEMP